ncbi:MAG: EcsC family protein [Candidatus Binataceae bacterium]
MADKLTGVAAGYATDLGALIGLAISGDELLTLFTGGEAGIGLPANIMVAATSIAAEAVLLVKIQLQLVAELAKVYGAPLEADDPEDALLILAFALGGGAAEEAGKFGMKLGGNLAASTMRRTIRKDVLQALQAIGRKVGVKILQRNLIKYSIPVASAVVGAAWNRTTTKAVARLAKNHMRDRPPRARQAERFR